MTGDLCEDLAQIGFRIEAVQFGCADQAVDRGGALPARIRSREQVILAAKDYGAQGAFGSVVVCVLKRCTVFPGESPGRLTLVPAGST
jgi:hypothetical protein